MEQSMRFWNTMAVVRLLSLLMLAIFVAGDAVARSGAGGGGGESRRSGGMDSGGGGRCEADLKLTLHILALRLERFGISLPKETAPDSLPALWNNTRVDVIDKTIRSEHEPEWKMAWANRATNSIKLYCLEDDDSRGWFSLDQRIKDVLVLHEVLWWKQAINDIDFNVSPEIIAKLYDKLETSAPNLNFFVTSSFYFELAGQNTSPEGRETYFSNIQRVWAAIEGAAKNIKLESIPPLSFKSATMNSYGLVYNWSYFQEIKTGPHTSLDCTIRLSFEKLLGTNAIQNVTAKESCIEFDETED